MIDEPDAMQKSRDNMDMAIIGMIVVPTVIAFVLGVMLGLAVGMLWC